MPNDEWQTPPDIIERARRVMGAIDFDPCSTEQANRIVNAARYCDKDHDGLLVNWEGKRIWMNPPYSRHLIGAFIAKFVQEGVRGIAITNASTDTKWFRCMLCSCKYVCLTSKRTAFIDPDLGKPIRGNDRGQAIWGRGVTGSFVSEFRALGPVIDLESGLKFA